MRKTLTVSLVLSLACAPLVNAAPRADASQDYGEDQDFSPEELDNLLAPIALYPDPLLAQVLLAATFVDQVDEAARYVRAYGERGVDAQDWDTSVRAVAHYPVVLAYLADKLDWTSAVGQAYVGQSTDVMISIQRLRHMARSEGNLETTPEQQVVLEDDFIRIVPASPTLIYVPRYNPAIVYAHRPVSGLAIAFDVGLVIGAWLNDDCDWREHRVYYHGWSGAGWIARSRPHVRITTVYVSPRYANVRINRRVIDRHLDRAALSRYDFVHRDVVYTGARSNDHQRAEPRVTSPPRGNALINHNMNTRDPRLDRFRGREDHGRPAAAAERPAPPAHEQARPEPAPRSQLHLYGGSGSGFDPKAASSRGHASREAAAKPQKAEAHQAKDRKKSQPPKKH
jgi:Protein of unknown function (DUF3300)